MVSLAGGVRGVARERGLGAEAAGLAADTDPKPRSPRAHFRSSRRMTFRSTYSAMAAPVASLMATVLG